MHFPFYQKKKKEKNRKRALGTNFRPQNHGRPPLLHQDPPVWIRRANGGVACVGGGMHACNARPLTSFSAWLRCWLVLLLLDWEKEGGVLASWVYRLEPFGNDNYYPRAEKTV